MSSTCSPGVLSVRPVDVRAASQDLKQLVSGLDPDAVVLGDAPEVWAEFDAIERVIASAKLLMARRVEQAHTWPKQGFRNAVEQIAVLSGTSMSSARSMLATSKHIADLPETAEVMRSGELSAAMTHAIVSAAAVAPDAEAELLAIAVRSPLAKLREESLKARAGVDRDAAHARIHRERHLREFIDAEGAWNLHARGTADDGAAFRVAIEPLIDAHFRTKRAVDQREPREAYAFDALIEMATASGSPDREPSDTKRAPAKNFGLLRIDYEAFVRGAVEGEEVCDLPGLGPIPVRIARELLGDAILKLVITKGVDVMNVTHLGRSATVAQQVALWYQQPCCTAEGCTRTYRLENDHRNDWAYTHRTRLDGLDPLCEHHHDLKTLRGWALVAGKGPRPMVPPDDPRHPRYRAPPPDA